MEVDEEIYDLLKRINKTKQLLDKYRTKATVLLDKLLHFNDYRIIDGEPDGQRLQRKAKAKPKDYTEKTTIHGRRRKKANSKRSGSQGISGDDDDDLQSDSQEEGKEQRRDSKKADDQQQKDGDEQLTSPKQAKEASAAAEKKPGKRGR